jgi:cytochrome c
MDTMEVNTTCAAVLVAGIAFFLTGLAGDLLVSQEPLQEPAIKIEGAPAAATAGAAPTAELPPIAPLLAKADPAKGEADTKKLCVSCHSFEQGGKAGVGPNLYGVVGAPHGHMEGFNYSAALKGKQGPWTFDELNQWLNKPSSYAPGTRMAFAGINSAQDRANVIDYLRTLSPNPEPLPSTEPAAATPTTPAPAAGEGAAGQNQPASKGGAAAPQAGGATGSAGATEGSTTQQRATSTQPHDEGGAAGAGSPTPDAQSR